MTNVTGSIGSIMSGRNEQAYLGSQYNNREIRKFLSKLRIEKARTVPDPTENTVTINEVDTNSDACCLGTTFIPLASMNRSADVYLYNDAYNPIENVPIVSGATAYDHPNGGT